MEEGKKQVKFMVENFIHNLAKVYYNISKDCSNHLGSDVIVDWDEEDDKKKKVIVNTIFYALKSEEKIDVRELYKILLQFRKKEKVKGYVGLPFLELELPERLLYVTLHSLIETYRDMYNLLINA